MLFERPRFINEDRYADVISPAELDRLLELGWRHFGDHFFRYNLSVYRQDVVRVLPLRIRLSDFTLTRSQRRILKRNHDLVVEFAPASVTREIEDLFHEHKRRFTHAVPDSIYDFVSLDPAGGPTSSFQVTARDRSGGLLAASFFDVGVEAVSAIYGCFDPTERRRGLGILTMLKVIEHAIASGRRFYYHGYAYDIPSFYDYKKRFSAIEYFDWEGNWLDLPAEH